MVKNGYTTGSFEQLITGSNDWNQKLV